MIPKLRFGRTGHISSRAIFGAVALGNVSDEQSERALEMILQVGINHIDVAASYGAAEDRLAPWMETHRDKFFLATKTTHRAYDHAREEIHRSLERMRVAQIDLIQLHNLVDEAEWESAFAPSGVLQAALEAREEGVARFIGVTGHGLQAPRMHIKSLERFDFDSVLFPLNYSLMQNAQYARDVEELRRLCNSRDVAMQTIKSICRRPKNAESLPRATWYEPLEDAASIRLAAHWLLGFPDVFLNTVGDMDVLPLVLEACLEYSRPPSDEEMEALLSEREMAPLFA